MGAAAHGGRGGVQSWNSDRARAYRSRESIPDDLGTAVTVQAMVFGNRGSVESGTGVLFTRNPSTGENVLFGDVLFNAQGEDVVAGTHAPSPIGELDTACRWWQRSCARYADLARAASDGRGRHRVHDRGRPAVDAPGPGRQEVAARGVAHGNRDGR